MNTLFLIHLFNHAGVRPTESFNWCERDGESNNKVDKDELGEDNEWSGSSGCPKRKYRVRYRMTIIYERCRGWGKRCFLPYRAFGKLYLIVSRITEPSVELLRDVALASAAQLRNSPAGLNRPGRTFSLYYLVLTAGREQRERRERAAYRTRWKSSALQSRERPNSPCNVRPSARFN